MMDGEDNSFSSSLTEDVNELENLKQRAFELSKEIERIDCCIVDIEEEIKPVKCDITKRETELEAERAKHSTIINQIKIVESQLEASLNQSILSESEESEEDQIIESKPELKCQDCPQLKETLSELNNNQKNILSCFHDAEVMFQETLKDKKLLHDKLDELCDTINIVSERRNTKMEELTDKIKELTEEKKTLFIEFTNLSANPPPLKGNSLFKEVEDKTRELLLAQKEFLFSIEISQAELSKAIAENDTLKEVISNLDSDLVSSAPQINPDLANSLMSKKEELMDLLQRYKERLESPQIVMPNSSSKSIAWINTMINQARKEGKGYGENIILAANKLSSESEKLASVKLEIVELKQKIKKEMNATKIMKMKLESNVKFFFCPTTNVLGATNDTRTNLGAQTTHAV